MLTIDEGAVAQSATPQAPEPQREAASQAPSPLPFALPQATRRPVVLTGDDAGRQVIHAIRQETGLSLRQIAERLGVRRGSVEQYQYRHINPSVKWLGRVVAAVGGRVVIEFPPVQ